MQSFENMFSSTVEKTLTLILGEEVTKAFYFHMSKNFDLKKDAMASRPDVLSEALNRTFGKGGQVIQRVIIRKLCDKTGVKYDEVSEDNLTSAISELKRTIFQIPSHGTIQVL